MHWRSWGRQVRRVVQRDRRLRWLLLLLSPLPVVLLLDLAQRLHQDEGRGFLAVEGDRSLIEVLGYLQAAAAIGLLLLALAVQRSAPVYAGWAVLYTGVLVDDAGELHERGGERMTAVGARPGVPGLDVQDVGELLVWAALGTVLLAVLAAAFLASDAPSRRTSWRFGVPLLLLVLFAVVVDMVNSQLHGAPPVVRLLGSWTEASGELAALSVLLALAADLHRPAQAQAPERSSRGCSS